MGGILQDEFQVLVCCYDGVWVQWWKEASNQVFLRLVRDTPLQDSRQLIITGHLHASLDLGTKIESEVPRRQGWEYRAGKSLEN